MDSSAGVGKFNLGIEIDNRLYTPSGEEVSGWSIPAPPVGDVTVYMRDESGRYSNTWPKFDDFTQNADYFIGQYTLAGWYGSEDLTHRFSTANVRLWLLTVIPPLPPLFCVR